jgi:hypothetical protein
LYLEFIIISRLRIPERGTGREMFLQYFEINYFLSAISGIRGRSIHEDKNSDSRRSWKTVSQLKAEVEKRLYFFVKDSVIILFDYDEVTAGRNLESNILLRRGEQR